MLLPGSWDDKDAESRVNTSPKVIILKLSYRIKNLIFEVQKLFLKPPGNKA